MSVNSSAILSSGAALNSKPMEQNHGPNNLGVFKRLEALKSEVASHPTFYQIGMGTASPEVHHNLLLHFYPLVENFPKFMALNLAKTRIEKAHHEEVKDWLITNIKVEKNHARWFIDWANGFGISTETMIHSHARPAVEAIVHYLWSKSHNRSLAVGLAAVNVGIEWAVGQWATYAYPNVSKYFDNGMASGKVASAARWLKVHAAYDDMHPYEAMDLVVKCATSKEDLEEALEAAERSLRFLAIGLDACQMKH